MKKRSPQQWELLSYRYLSAPPLKSDTVLFSSSRRGCWIYAPKRQWIPRMGRGTLEVPDGTGSRRAGIYPEEKIEPERTTIK